jgi:hypothetical protein
MARIEVGKCGACGHPLRVKDRGVRATLHLTCRCGWSGSVTVPEEIVRQAERSREGGALLTALFVVGGLFVLAGAATAGYYGWVTSGGIGIPVGALIGGLVALFLATLAGHVLADIAEGRRLGVPFRLSLRTHNMLAWALGAGCAVAGFNVALSYRESLGGGGSLLRDLLVFGILVLCFLVPRYLLRLVLPARCPECGGPAYYAYSRDHGQIRHGHYEVTIWSTHFTCRACGKTSSDGHG